MNEIRERETILHIHRNSRDTREHFTYRHLEEFGFKEVKGTNGTRFKNPNYDFYIGLPYEHCVWDILYRIDSGENYRIPKSFHYVEELKKYILEGK